MSEDFAQGTEIDIEYEERFLKDFLSAMRIYNPNLYDKVNETGAIAKKIGKEIGIENPEFYLAGYYANVGFLGVDCYVKKPDLLNDDDKKLVRMHPLLSQDFLEKKGLLYCAKLAYSHHEMPDGSGYYREVNFPEEASIINIADTFQGCVSPKSYRPQLVYKEAIKLTLAPYFDSMSFSREKINVIKEVLHDFYYSK
jgi:HD-GYP domain-containing protein (c-di-GMP phosphodiesterase class II)